jgi:hypothetical protein
MRETVVKDLTAVLNVMNVEIWKGGTYCLSVCFLLLFFFVKICIQLLLYFLLFFSKLWNNHGRFLQNFWFWGAYASFKRCSALGLHTAGQWQKVLYDVM